MSHLTHNISDWWSELLMIMSHWRVKYCHASIKFLLRILCFCVTYSIQSGSQFVSATSACGPTPVNAQWGWPFENLTRNYFLCQMEGSERVLTRQFALLALEMVSVNNLKSCCSILRIYIYIQYINIKVMLHWKLNFIESRFFLYVMSTFYSN